MSAIDSSSNPFTWKVNSTLVTAVFLGITSLVTGILLYHFNQNWTASLCCIVTGPSLLSLSIVIFIILTCKKKHNPKIPESTVQINTTDILPNIPGPSDKKVLTFFEK